MTIREAISADVDGLVASNSALFAADAAVRDPLRNPGWPDAHAAGHVTETLANPDMLVLVAEHGNAVVGHLTGAFLPASAMWTAPRAELFSMQVMAPWRSQGIGSQLVDRFKAWAHAGGLTRTRACGPWCASARRSRRLR